MELPAPETLRGLAVVVRVAETESFSAAARQLSMTPSGVSKAISRLEERFGVRLFDRTTRRVAPTEDGLRFYERCRRILSDLEEAQAELRESTVQPRGTIVATVPRAVGEELLIPALPHFLARYPDLDLRLELADRRVDIIGERIDVALRMGAPTSSAHGRLVRREVGSTAAVVCAAPTYLQERGRPRRPEDLAKHNVLFYGSHRGEGNRAWVFSRGKEQRRVELDGNVTLDSGRSLVDLACRGAGVIAVFDFIASSALETGSLERVLPKWRVWDRVPMTLVFPKHRLLSAKIRAFADFIEETVGPKPRP